jgi:hypothetical protein
VVESIESYLDGKFPTRALNPDALERRAAG